MYGHNQLLVIFLAAGCLQGAGHPGVVKITAVHGDVQALGSGVCLDTPCLHVLTNYHVAAYLGAALKVEGFPVVRLQSFTGPEDAGAQAMEAGFGTYQYNPARDLSLLTLESALPYRFSRLAFTADEPKIGQPVLRSARFGDEYDVSAGRIVADALTHTSAEGVLTPLPRHFLLDCASRPGNSGGAVLDAAGRAIGLIAMRSSDAKGQAGTIVVSSAVIADFLRSANQALWKNLFPVPEPVARQITPLLPDGLTGLVAPVGEPSEAIQMLRETARANAAALRNIVAVENIVTWGQDRVKRSWTFQLTMHADGLRYRRIAVSGAPAKHLETAPETAVIAWPRMTGVVPGEQWSLTPLLLDDATIDYQGTATYAGRAVHVFHYASSARGCASRSAGKTNYALCSGTVLADSRMNAVLITQRMDLPGGEAAVIRWTETYQTIALGGRNLLLPAELTMTGEFRTGRIYYASAQWTGFRAFASETVVRFGE